MIGSPPFGVSRTCGIPCGFPPSGLRMSSQAHLVCSADNCESDTLFQFFSSITNLDAPHTVGVGLVVAARGATDLGA